MRLRYVSGQLEVDRKDYVDQEIISASFPSVAHHHHAFAVVLEE